MQRLQTLLSFTAIFAVVSASAQASVIYSNLGAGDTFNVVAGSSVSGAASTNNNFVSIALSFVPSSEYIFTSIELPVSHFNSGLNTNFLTASLRQNSGGIPGATLESFSQTITPTVGTLTTFTSVGGVTLNAGTAYWIVLEPTTDTDYIVWHRNATGATGLSFLLNSNPWTADTGLASPAMRVNGILGTAAAPEPGTLALVTLAIPALIARRRRTH
jgi:hypothetical protein